MAFKNHDSPLYFRAAQEAARLEREGKLRAAAQEWQRAFRLSRNIRNIEWASNRSDFCTAQILRNQYNRGDRPAAPTQPDFDALRAQVLKSVIGNEAGAMELKV